MSEKKLNRRQERFCQEYVNSGNATWSYKVSYWTDDDATAAANGSRLLRNDKIAARIRELTDEAATVKTLSAAQIRLFWSECISNENNRMADRLTASNLLAKSSGLFIDRADIEFRGNVKQEYAEVILPPLLPEEACLWHGTDDEGTEGRENTDD